MRLKLQHARSCSNFGTPKLMDAGPMGNSKPDSLKGFSSLKLIATEDNIQ